MHDTDHTTRIALVESHITNMGNVIQDIRHLLKTSINNATENHQITIQRLSVIETKQDACNAYQIECDDSRQAITDRIVLIERGDSKQAGKATIINAMVAAIISAFVGLAAVIAGKLWH